MTEFRDQDLKGASFERVNLRESTFNEVEFNDSHMRSLDFTGQTCGRPL